jgi:hypothetical protein
MEIEERFSPDVSLYSGFIGRAKRLGSKLF